MLSLARLRIETDRLVLRPPVEDDAGRIAELANHIEIARYLATMPHPYGADDAREFIAKVAAAQNGAVFVICPKPHGEVIGVCGYGPPPGEDYIDFGYWLGLDYWGQGFALEAAGGVLTHAFCVGQVDVIETDCRLDNRRSKRLLDALGFETIGRGERFSLGTGETAQTYRVRLACDDWLAAKACA